MRRPPIPSMRLSAMRLSATVLSAMLLSAMLLSGCTSDRATSEMPTCSRLDQRILVLEAQAVPSATELPCVSDLPAGWTYSGFDIKDGSVSFWLDNDRAGIRAVEVDLTTSCDVSHAVAVDADPDEVGATVYQEPMSLPPHFTGVRFLVFPGGCVSYRYAFANNAPSALTLEAQQALSMVPRGPIVDLVRKEFDLTLCGAGAPPCEG